MTIRPPATPDQPDTTPAADLIDTIAPGWKAWRGRIESGQAHHGLGPSTYLPGDVQHLVSPLVGMLRLMERDGEAPDVDDVAYLIDRLSFVLDIAREADAEPSDLLDHYARTNPDAALDALTRAGVLHEEGQTQLVWEADPDGIGADEPGGPTLRLAGHVNEVRLVTEWREVQS